MLVCSRNKLSMNFSRLALLFRACALLCKTWKWKREWKRERGREKKKQTIGGPHRNENCLTLVDRMWNVTCVLCVAMGMRDFMGVIRDQRADSLWKRSLCSIFCVFEWTCFYNGYCLTHCVSLLTLAKCCGERQMGSILVLSTVLFIAPIPRPTVVWVWYDAVLAWCGITCMLLKVLSFFWNSTENCRFVGYYTSIKLCFIESSCSLHVFVMQHCNASVKEQNHEIRFVEQGRNWNGWELYANSAILAR